jgi:hypothetical protein
MKKKYTGPLVSDAFRNTLVGGGATAVTCSYCDREHIAIDSSNIYDNYVSHLDEKVEDIERKAAEDPDTYVIVRDVDFIHYVDINGMDFPDDCPCNGLARYEEFIWDNRERWFSYYAVRKLQIMDELASLDPVKIQ